MDVSKKPRALDWQALAAMGLGLARTMILMVLAEGGNEPMASSDLATEPRIAAAVGGRADPLVAVSYHVHVLVKDGLLEKTGQVLVKGSLKRFYRLTPAALLSEQQAVAARMQHTMNTPVGTGKAQRFRKLPVEITAVLWTGENIMDVQAFMEPEQPVYMNGYSNADDLVGIATLEGLMTASKGDWIIRGVKGELYPCKPDVFEATYEAVT